MLHDKYRPRLLERVRVRECLRLQRGAHRLDIHQVRLAKVSIYIGVLDGRLVVFTRSSERAVALLISESTIRGTPRSVGSCPGGGFRLGSASPGKTSR